MPVIARPQAKAATPATRPAATPAPQARAVQPAPQAAPARGAGKQRASSFSEARTRGNNGIFLGAIDRENVGVYDLRVNRVKQIWRDPTRVNPMFAQPTEYDLSVAEPAFKPYDSYVIEVEVVASNNPRQPAGFQCSIVFTDRYPDSYMGDIKGFLSAVFCAEPKDVTEQDWQDSWKEVDDADGKAQPCAGRLLHCVAREKKNKNNDGGFTQYIFSPNEDQAAFDAAQATA